MDELAGGDATKYEAVLRLENSTALLKMQMEAAKSWIAFELSKKTE